MLIKEIRLSPFGGVMNRTVSLSPGLNVVLGPNEAGKSTLVNAAFAALFLLSSSKKGSRDWKDYLSRYMPHPHGDTAEVSLTFSAGKGACYTLTRAFGEGRKAQLLMPDGSSINNETAVQEELNRLLCYGRGTYEGILFARQDEMVKTVKMLSENREAISTLGDVLRNLVLRTGGVSVEELAAAIEEEEKALLSRWDVGRDGPQNNRGIDNPYEKGCGQLLLAYYEQEKLKRQMAEISRLENLLEGSTQELKAAVKEKEEKVDPRRREMELLERDIRQRGLLEPKLEMQAEKEKTLKSVNVGWPKMEERLAHLQQQQEAREKKHQELQQEYTEAQRILAGRGKRQLYQRVKPIRAEALAMQLDLAKLPSVSIADVKVLEERQVRGARLKATIEAMKLKGRITTLKSSQVVVTSGLNRKENLQVEGEAFFTAAGRVLLEGEGWSVEIKPGEQDVDKLISEAKENRQLYDVKLRELKVANLQEARDSALRREKLANSIREWQGKVNLLLRGADFADLEAEVAELPQDKPVREPESILRDLTQEEVELSLSSEEIKSLHRQLQSWQAEYGHYDEVMEVLAEMLRQKKEIQRGLANLAPLPAGYGNPEEFMASLEEIRQKGRELDEVIYSLKLKVSEQKNNLPEETSEELQEKYELKNKEFLHLREKARAFLILQEEFQEITAQIQNQTFDPLLRSLNRFLPPLTNHRYAVAVMDGAIPGSIATLEGRELPLELLSTGTAGGLALALRLAISEYLLQDMEGTLFMDDPLVGLDPARKEEAAAIIREFATLRQIIITTCEPATAALLGGALVELKA